MSGGGGGSKSAKAANALLAQQIAMQQREYEQQLAALGEQEFSIVKSQGGMNWNAKTPTGINNNPGHSNGGFPPWHWGPFNPFNN